MRKLRFFFFRSPDISRLGNGLADAFYMVCPFLVGDAQIIQNLSDLRLVSRKIIVSEYTLRFSLVRNGGIVSEDNVGKLLRFEDLGINVPLLIHLFVNVTEDRKNKVCHIIHSVQLSFGDRLTDIVGLNVVILLGDDQRRASDIFRSVLEIAFVITVSAGSAKDLLDFRFNLLRQSLVARCRPEQLAKVFRGYRDLLHVIPHCLRLDDSTLFDDGLFGLGFYSGGSFNDGLFNGRLFSCRLFDDWFFNDRLLFGF